MLIICVFVRLTVCNADTVLYLISSYRVRVYIQEKIWGSFIQLFWEKT